MKIQNHRYGWLAGIIDGEGTITITRQFRVLSYSYRPEIHVTNTNMEMLFEVVSIIEAIIGKKPKIFLSDSRNEKKVYRVRIQDRKSCLKLAKILSNILVAKKRQALLLIEFLQGESINSETQAARIRQINASSSSQAP